MQKPANYAGNANQPVRICVDAREFSGRGQTGIGRYLQNLLVPLANNKQVHLTCCVNCGTGLPQAMGGRVQIERLPRWPTPLTDQIALSLMAARHRADWFFSPYYKTPLHGPFRKVITVHDIMFLRLETAPPMKRRMAALQLRMAAGCADIILVDSDFTAADLTDYLPSARTKIRRLYPDLAPSWFNPDGQHADLPDFLSDLRPYFLYVGNFKPHKHVDPLIDGFADLIKSTPALPHRLVLAGADPLNTPAVKAKLAVMHLEDRALVVSEVPEERLLRLYQNADWLVTASGYEGFGYPVVEAFAAGCPVICRLETSLREIAGDAVMPLPDATPGVIAATLRDACHMPSAKRRELIAKGRQRAELFRPGKAASQFLQTVLT